MRRTNNKDEVIEAVCFTGHRHIERTDAFSIPTRLKAILTELIARGVKRFRAGGAIGFDTVAALCVIELKESYPEISLELVLPCRDQTKSWEERDRIVYDYILSQASSVEYVAEHYTPWCMHERNRRLVNESQACIAYLKQSSGGTAYTYSYALKKNLEVINLAE